MRGHKPGSESPRTAPAPRLPPGEVDLAAFRAHYGRTRAFSAALRESRCKRTNHFNTRLGETVAAFKPLFAPWNMEILFLLYMGGARRFNALKRELGGVSSRVLTDKLRHLAAGGLVARAEDGEGVAYALTPRGRIVASHLHPLLFFLHNEDRLPDVAAADAHPTPGLPVIDSA